MYKSKKLLFSGVALAAALAASVLSPVTHAATVAVTSTGTALITLTNDNEALFLGGVNGTVSYTVVDLVGELGLMPEPEPGDSGVLEGVRNVVINARGGNNDVLISQLILDGYLTVRSGSGGDYIELYQVIVGGNLSVISGTGPDQIDINSTDINGFSTISTSSGDDLIRISMTQLRGRSRVLTGLGDDELYIGSPANPPMIDDTYEVLEPNAFGGDVGTMYVMEKELSLNDCLIQNVVMEYMLDNPCMEPEFPRFFFTDFGSSMVINTSGGDDIFKLGAVTVDNNVSVSTGSGSDTVVIFDSLFESAFSVNGGAQNDDVTNTRNNFIGNAIFRGASGNGDIFRDGLSPFPNATAQSTSFEIFLEPLPTMMMPPMLETCTEMYTNLEDVMEFCDVN